MHVVPVEVLFTDYFRSGKRQCGFNSVDRTGELLQSGSINLAAQGHTSFMLAAAYASAANVRGMVEFLVPTGGKISVIGLRAKADGNVTTIPVLTK